MAGTRWGGLVVLLALSLFAFAAMVGLGAWQLQRLDWKLGLKAKLEARIHAVPVDWPAARARLEAGEDVEYLRVRASGHFLHAHERHLYATGPTTWGWQVITPLEMAPGEVILVNRGFVPDAKKAPSSRASGLPEGAIEIVGLLRRPLPGKPWVSPDNEPAANRWYWLDLAGMVAGVPAGHGPWTKTVILEAEALPGAPEPNGGVTRLDLANRHLEYALTWFALAGTLLAVLAVFLVGRRQRQSG